MPEAATPAGAALEKLIRLLQNAHAGELAAGWAYRGHANSVRSDTERARIREIEADEWHHRELVAGMLRQLGARPRPARELTLHCIGKTIAFLCHVGGWFMPMYGAGRLERHNIVEYEDAAIYAAASGHQEMIDCLLTMAEVEWEHERYFRERIVGHGLLRLFPLWEAPPPKSSIRARHEVGEEAALVVGSA
ncbi:MAG TPA: ferritin-like domain-containing protein [Thermoanaerobaculia bacterium]|nr:ferritin-like domain-containing protein [Thermoanaerobaculia bacterium]